MNIKSIFKNQFDKSKPKVWRGLDAVPSIKTTERITKTEYDHRLKEIKKCKEDILYFAENYFYITTLDGGKQIIKLYKKQKETLKAFQDYNRVVLLSARQSGKTVSYCVFCLWYLMFNQDKSILIVANKKNTALEIISRIRFAYELIPHWLKPAVVTFNKSKIEWSNNSKIEGESTSSEAARGKTANILIVDEAARIRKNMLDVFWTSVYPIISSGKESKVFLVSTANGIGGLFYDTYTSAKSLDDPTISKIDWVKVVINWWERPGRDENWKQLQLKSISQEEFDQEYGNSFLSSSNKTLVPMNKIEEFLKFFNSKKFFFPKVLSIECPSQLKFSCYQWFEHTKGRTYIIGIDTGEGIGQNASTMEVFDITDTQRPIEVLSFSSNKISYQDFAYLIFIIAQMYDFPYISGENNGISSNIFTILSSSLYEYQRFVNIDSVNNSNPPRKSHGEFRLGIHSTHKIKMDACLFLKQYLVDGNNIVIFNRDLIDEMLFFAKNRESFASIANKKPDDRMLALIWSIYPLKEVYSSSLFIVDSFETLKNGKIIPKYIKYNESAVINYDELVVDREDSPNYDLEENTYELNIKDVSKIRPIDNINKKTKVRKEVWFIQDEDGNMVPDFTSDELNGQAEYGLGGFESIGLDI